MTKWANKKGEVSLDEFKKHYADYMRIIESRKHRSWYKAESKKVKVDYSKRKRLKEAMTEDEELAAKFEMLCGHDKLLKKKNFVKHVGIKIHKIKRTQILKLWKRMDENRDGSLHLAEFKQHWEVYAQLVEPAFYLRIMKARNKSKDSPGTSEGQSRSKSKEPPPEGSKPNDGEELGPGKL